MVPPLPVREAVSRSLRHVVRHGGMATRIAAPWYLLVVLVMAILGPAAPVRGDAQSELTGNEVLTLLIVMAVQLLAISATATRWHRLALLGEPPGALLSRPPVQVWRYVGMTLAIGLLGAAAAFAALLVLQLVAGLPSSANPVAVTLVLWFIAGIALLVSARLSLVLPAAALGRRLTLGQAADLAAGNSWRIAAAMLAIALLTAIPSLAMDALAARAGEAGRAIIGLGFANLFAFAGTLFGASLLNHVYVWCDGRGPNGEVLNI